jgi:cysteine desulfurase
MTFHFNHNRKATTVVENTNNNTAIITTINEVRAKIANQLRANEQEIFFTNEMPTTLYDTLLQYLQIIAASKNEALVCVTEEPWMLHCMQLLIEQGLQVHWIPVDRGGMADIEFIKKNCNEKTLFVNVMLANAETGVMQDIESIANIASAHESLMISNCSHAIGKIDFDVIQFPAQLICLSVSTVGGPLQLGAVYMLDDKRTGSIKAAIQEKNIALPDVIAFEKSLVGAFQNLWNFASHTSYLRTYFEQKMEYMFPNAVRINGLIKHRLPNTTCICFEGMQDSNILRDIRELLGIRQEDLMHTMNVLKCMQLSDADAKASISFSFGMENSVAQLEKIAKKILNSDF